MSPEQADSFRVFLKLQRARLTTKLEGWEARAEARRKAAESNWLDTAHVGVDGRVRPKKDLDAIERTWH